MTVLEALNMLSGKIQLCDEKFNSAKMDELAHVKTGDAESANASRAMATMWLQRRDEYQKMYNEAFTTKKVPDFSAHDAQTVKES